MAVNLGTIWAELGLRLDKFDQGLREAEASIKQAENRFEGFQAAGERLSGMGQKMTMGVTLPIVGIAVASGNMAMTFNAAMADVATLIPGNTQRVEELKTAVQDMAIETGKRTADLTRGLYQVVSAFGDTADTARILETNARAAAAGLATTEEAIALTSAVTKGYGDTSAEAVAKASDLALLTVRLGQTTFPELAGSIGRVTPLASAMGVSMEELFATMATLTGVTGSAAEVSTQLRGVLQGLMAPSEDMQKALAAMGYESGTLALESLGLQGVLQGLAAQTGGNKEQLAGLWGQVEAGVGVLALTGGQADTFSQRLIDMQGYMGATETAFKEQTEGVNEAGFAWQQMRAQLEVTAQQIGDVLAPVLTQLIGIVTPLVAWFASLDDGTKKGIITVALLAAAIGPLLVILGTLLGAIVQVTTAMAVIKTWTIKATIMKGLAAAVGVLKAAFLVLTGPIGLIIAAVALLAAGVVLLIRNWDTVGPFFARLWAGVTATFSAAITSLGGRLQSAWDFVAGGFSGLVERIRSILSGVVEAIAAPFRRAQEIVSGITSTIGGFLQRLNPFARFSPSLVDNVRAGVRAIQSEYAKLERLQLPAVSAMMPQAAAAGTAGPGMAAPGISAYHGPLFTVQNMTVRSDDDIQKISRLLQRDIQAGIRARGGR